MLEPIKCSCNASIGDKYLIYIALVKILGDDKKNEILKNLNVKRNCCKLKFLSCVLYSDLF